jgi:hypothetical protein
MVELPRGVPAHAQIAIEIPLQQIARIRAKMALSHCLEILFSAYSL